MVTIKHIHCCLAIATALFLLNCTSTKNLQPKSFTKKEAMLITHGDYTTPMRVYKITNKSDSILLRQKSSYIKPDPSNQLLQTFVKKLYATVRDSMSLGVGIAAPQVGILKNIIWVQRFDKDNFPFEVYLNPEIVIYSPETQTVREGCLSIPNRSETLSSRSKAINIAYDTLKGEHKLEHVEGFTAVIFQHEVDHLNGILYLDHLKKDMQSP